MANDREMSGGKKTYTAPKLTVYGSVRDLTGTKSGTFTTDTSMMQMNDSDRLVKENIVRVGEHPAGIGLYLFDYKPEFAHFGAGRQFGVMADEVLEVMPQAVARGDHGYLRVNYAMLGITRH